MKKYIMPIVCLASMMMCSCGGSEDNPEKDYYEAVSASAFSYVTDRDGVGKVFDGPTYRITYDNDALTAVVKMENVRFADSSPFESLMFSNVPWRFDSRSKARIIDVASITPDGKKSPEITNLKIVTYPVTTIGESEMDGMAVSYKVNGMFDVTNVCYRTVFVGATETVNMMSQASFVSTDPVYTVDINPYKMSGVLKIKGAKFDPNMPALDMEFAGLDVTIREGGFVLTSESLVPTIAGTPYPRYQITSLRMEVKLGGASELSFVCMGAFKVDAVFEAAYTAN